MPRNVAIGINEHHGVINFSNSKKKRVVFDRPFTIIPSIQITLENVSDRPEYTVTADKDHFFIRLERKYTGTASWSVQEM